MANLFKINTSYIINLDNVCDIGSSKFLFDGDKVASNCLKVVFVNGKTRYYREAGNNNYIEEKLSELEELKDINC